MIILGIFMSIAAIGMCCWLMFSLSTHALPLFCAICAGQLAYASGAGILGALVVGFLAAVQTLAAVRVLLASTRSTIGLLAIALAFAAPAAVAGYCAVHGIVRSLVQSEFWQFLFSALGAIAVGAAALRRLVEMAPAITPKGPTSARR